MELQERREIANFGKQTLGPLPAYAAKWNVDRHIMYYKGPLTRSKTRELEADHIQRKFYIELA